MGTTINAIFNGNSRYSADFQAVIDRASAIASMPISQLNDQKTTLKDQGTALTSLGDSFSKLQDALDGVTESLGGSSFSATISDPSTLAVNLGNGAMEGNYSIEVLDAGTYAQSQGKSAWVDDDGPTHHFQLSFDGKSYDIDAADNRISSVAMAINSGYSDKVRATVVNVGSAGSPDYRISLQAVTLGDLKPDLLDGDTSLQDTPTTGVRAHYIVNGSGIDVYSDSRAITIADGITIDLKESSDEPVNITVTRSSSAVDAALKQFVDAYNGAVDEVNKQYGDSGGALSGQNLVRQLSQVLSGIATYSIADGKIGALAALGIELAQDNSGHLTYNSFSLLSADLLNSTGVTSFLGGADSGFLKFAADTLSDVEKSGSGLIPLAQASLTEENSRIDASIAGQQAIVDRMKEQMQVRMAAADALIASMEQQYSYLFNMFEAMRTASEQYR